MSVAAQAREKQKMKEEIPLEIFETLKPGLFFHTNLEAVHHDMLERNIAPYVKLSG